MPLGGKHPAPTIAKAALGFGYTKIVCVIESTQFPVAVKIYFIVCVPGPAMAGLKLPVDEVPDPLYTPVPVAPFVTVAVATEITAVEFSQTAANAGYANAGFTLKVLVTIESTLQPLVVVTVSLMVNGPVG